MSNVGEYTHGTLAAVPSLYAPMAGTKRIGGVGSTRVTHAQYPLVQRPFATLHHNLGHYKKRRSPDGAFTVR